MSTAAQHTEGPWSVGGDGWVVVGPDGKWIGDARTVSRPIEEEHANARMFAAATELLAELRAAIDSLDYVQTHFPNLVGCGVRAERIKSAQAVIAKATGSAA